MYFKALKSYTYYKRSSSSVSNRYYVNIIALIALASNAYFKLIASEREIVDTIT